MKKYNQNLKERVIADYLSGDGFGYLSLITDALSCKMVGFCLHKTLSAKSTIAALKQALRNNSNTKGLIHHSDRGVCSIAARSM